MAAIEITRSVRHPQWVLIYAGVDITSDISAMVTDITYRDYAAHYTDEVEVVLEDRDRRWQGAWLPTRGDSVILLIGYAGEDLLPCGAFQVDDLEFRGPPDELRLRCIASGITPSIRTQRWAAYESMTLGQVAQTVAARHQMTFIDSAEAPNVQFARVTQSGETDLAFLRRVAWLHNYDFSIRGGQLIFYSRSQLENTPPVYAISRSGVTRFEFRMRSEEVYSSGAAAYHNPATKRLIRQSANDVSSPTGDELNIVTRCETAQQANLKATAALHDANMLQTVASLALEGATLLIAGNNTTISGFGMMDGTYHIISSTHRLNRRTGYSTEIEARRVA